MELDREIAGLFPGLGGAEQRAAWDGLVRKALKGEDPATLVRTDADGLAAQPLYTAQDAPVLPALGRAAPAGERPWDIRTLVTDAGPADANTRALEDLQNGGSSVLLVLDPAADERLGVDSAEALAQVLEGVLLDIAPVALDAGFLGPQAADWLAAAAKGGPSAPLAFHLDPLGAFARAGTSPGPIQAHLEAAAAAAARHSHTYPKSTAFLASGRAVHEAGGSPVQELAFALAAALAYAKALAAAGLSLQDALSRVVLGVAIDGEYNAGVCKLRAARLMWNRLAEASGAAVPARIEARASRRMLSGKDAWTNLLRLTAAGFSGAVGGADAVVLEPFTGPLGAPSSLARRQARNIQLLLMEESHLGDVEDPAAGAWALDRMTWDLAEAAWTRFQAIEAQGGLIAALLAGDLAAEVAAARDAAQAQFAAGRVILGANRHADPALNEPAVNPHRAGAAAAPAPRLPGADSACPPLAPVRWSAPFEKEG